MDKENNDNSVAVSNEVYRFTTARRTITETDIVNFVNLIGLHLPLFMDMEYLKENMAGNLHQRFAPGPFLICLGMGLVAPFLMDILNKVLEGEEGGRFGGMTGLEARMLAPAFPGDTLKVEVEASIRKRTGKGNILINLRQLLRNQREEEVVDYTETILYMVPQ